MNKRGDGGIDISLETLIGLAAGLLIVIALFQSTFIKNLFGFISDDQEQGTMNSFQELVKIIRSDKNDLNSLAVPYYIGNNFILVGFNKDNEGLYDHCDPEKVPRPATIQCANTACLCIYKETVNDIDFEVDDQPVKCESLDVDFIFTLDYYDSAPEKGNIKYTNKKEIYQNIIGPRFTVDSNLYTEEYANLFIYGQCEDWDSVFGSDINFGIQKLYVEKLTDTDKNKVFLFIADSASGARYKERFAKENEPAA